MGDLSSLTREQTHSSCTGNSESYQWTIRDVPKARVLKNSLPTFLPLDVFPQFQPSQAQVTCESVRRLLSWL